MNISACFFINYLSLSILLYFFSVFLHVMPTSESFVVALKSLLACSESRSLHTSYLSFLLHLIEFFFFLRNKKHHQMVGLSEYQGGRKQGLSCQF